MNLFPFWLITFTAIGAILGTTLRLGIPEIVIIWALLVGLPYLHRNPVATTTNSG